MLVIQLFGSSCYSVFSVTLVQYGDSREYAAVIHVLGMKDIR